MESTNEHLEENERWLASSFRAYTGKHFRRPYIYMWKRPGFRMLLKTISFMVLKRWLRDQEH